MYGKIKEAKQFILTNGLNYYKKNKKLIKKRMKNKNLYLNLKTRMNFLNK